MTETFKVIAKGRLFGLVETRNIFYCQTDSLGSATQDDVNTDLASWTQSFYSPLAAAITPTFALYATETHKWVAGPGWSPMGEKPNTFVGASVNTTLPGQVAAVLLGKTTGKRSFGRKFIAGITAQEMVDGLMVSGMMTLLSSALAAWITPFTGTLSGIIFQPGIWRKDNTFASITSGIVDALAGTMRRRKPGVGI